MDRYKLNILKETLSSDGLVFIALTPRAIKILNKIRNNVDTTFPQPDSYYASMSNDDFRNLILECQENINNSKVIDELITAELTNLSYLIGCNEISIQSNVYLRATRPNATLDAEYVDWHRESMYSDLPCVKEAFNLWLPLKNVNENNSLKYIPKSHIIPSEDIVFKRLEEGSSGVHRFSVGHKIGITYAPKKIISGIDFTAAQVMDVPSNSCALFAAELIHGAAYNKTDKIRFSIDLRLVDSNKVTAYKTHFASGESYFRKLNLNSLDKII